MREFIENNSLGVDFYIKLFFLLFTSYFLIKKIINFNLSTNVAIMHSSELARSDPRNQTSLNNINGKGLVSSLKLENTSASFFGACFISLTLSENTINIHTHELIKFKRNIGFQDVYCFFEDLQTLSIFCPKFITKRISTYIPSDNVLTSSH